MPVNRERKKVEQEIDTIHYEMEGSIDDAIAYLQRMKERYPNSFISYEDVRAQYDPGPERYGMVLKAMVEETDEQYATRIAHEEKMVAWQEERDRKLYEDLKKKYDNKA